MYRKPSPVQNIKDAMGLGESVHRKCEHSEVTLSLTVPGGIWILEFALFTFGEFSSSWTKLMIILSPLYAW